MTLRPATGPIPKPTPKRKDDPRPMKSRPHRIPERTRAAAFDEWGYVCRWCEVPGGALDLHHRHRRSQGGKDEPSRNLVPVHRLCHQAIHTTHITEAKRRRFLVSRADELDQPVEGA